MSLCLMNVHGDIEGDYEFVCDIPNGTNGEVIQALFPNAFYNGGRLFMHIINVNNIGEITIPWRWWNAPYKADMRGET